MKKNRWIFYIIFGLFHLALVVFTFYVDANKEDFGFLYGLLKMMTLAKVLALAGLILLVIDIIWNMTSSKSAEKERDVLAHELNVLKAKLFDLQEAARKTSNENPPPTKF